MGAQILLTGGTGTLGRHVLPLLRDAGAGVRVLSRRPHEDAAGVEYVTGDLLKDEGVEAAVDGVGTVLHLAGGAKGDDEATRNLVRAAARAGVRHAVLISVIGADRVPLGYLRTQLRGGGPDRVGRAVDDPARRPVPRPGVHHGAEDGEAAGRPGAGRPALPAGRLARSGRPPGGAGARRARRPRARPGRP